jgi:hypothetical protein
MTDMSRPGPRPDAEDEIRARLSQEAQACVALWRAVIYEQIELALRVNPSAVDTATAIAQARAWFGTAHFRKVCGLALLEPDWVLRAYQRRQREPSAFRHGAGRVIRRFSVDDARQVAR